MHNPSFCCLESISPESRLILRRLPLCRSTALPLRRSVTWEVPCSVLHCCRDRSVQSGACGVECGRVERIAVRAERRAREGRIRSTRGTYLTGSNHNPTDCDSLIKKGYCARLHKTSFCFLESISPETKLILGRLPLCRSITSSLHRSVARLDGRWLAPCYTVAGTRACGAVSEAEPSSD